jgi:hypothetical protein
MEITQQFTHIALKSARVVWERKHVAERTEESNFKIMIFIVSLVQINHKTRLLSFHRDYNNNNNNNNNNIYILKLSGVSNKSLII